MPIQFFSRLSHNCTRFACVRLFDAYVCVNSSVSRAVSRQDSRNALEEAFTFTLPAIVGRVESQFWICLHCFSRSHVNGYGAANGVDAHADVAAKSSSTAASATTTTLTSAVATLAEQRHSFASLAYHRRDSVCVSAFCSS